MLKPSELLQLMREVSLSQIRKQIKLDQKSKAKSYLSQFSFEWINRSQILEEFFNDAKNRKS